MPLEFAGQVGIVTGGANGIGQATALELARRGARVFVADLGFDSRSEQAFAPLDVTQLTCDVRREPQVAAVIETVIQQAGRLNLLVSNAGINLVKQVPDVTEAEWDACLDTNLKGSFLFCKHAIPHLRAAGGGAVVFTASNAGLLPRAHDPVYCTSKAALIALASSLALCHAADKIRFNTVCPGPVSDTQMIETVLAAAPDRAAAEHAFIEASPLARAAGRMIRPDEVAQAIVYLLGPSASMVTGTALRIDGGKSLGVPPQTA